MGSFYPRWYPIKSSVMNEARTPVLGEGVYTLAEVSTYTRVPRVTLRHWFLPRADKAGLGAVFESDWRREDGDFAVSFMNLIEAYVASFFKQNGVSHADIRRTHKILRDQMHTPHPFAYANLRVGLRQIVQEVQGGNESVRYRQVIDSQLLFPEFNDGLLRIDYNPETRLADGWRIADGVFVSPRIGFGKPVIDRTGISTLIVANQYKANGKNAALVARLFGINQSGVMNAYRFEAQLGRIAA